MADDLRRWASGARGRFLLSCLAGGVAGLGQAPFGLWVAPLLGFALGFWLWQRSETLRQAAAVGWGLGIGYFALVLHWLVNPFFVEPEIYGWMAPFALIGMAAGLALLWAIGTGLAFGLMRRGAPGGWIIWAAGLTAAELLRGRLFTGFPWGGPGLAWIDTPLAQLAAWIGANGLSFLTFLVAASLLAGWDSRSRARHFSLLAAGLALAFGLSILRQSQPLPADTDITLRLIQPNAAQHLKWHPDHALSFVYRQLDMSGAAPQTDRAPDLIIWPETAIPYQLQQAGELLREVSRVAQDKPVMVGIQRGDGLRFYNSLAVIGAGGQVEQVYDKHHLVPFGEYVPLGDQMQRFGIRAFASQLGQGYSAGPAPQVLDLGPLGRVLPLICFEAIFPHDIASATPRADWLLQITNDAWFGSFAEPKQHFNHARMRAIEFGLPVVRVANTGITAIVDAHGATTARLPSEQAAFLDASLPSPLPETLYVRWGDVALVLLLLGLCTTLEVARFTRNSLTL